MHSPTTKELRDLGHKGLGKCQGEEGHSQPRGSPRKLSHRQFSGLGTFGAQWDSHRVWLHLIGLP